MTTPVTSRGGCARLVIERRLDRGVSDGWAWRRWNGEVVEDTAPEPYGDAWHSLIGKVVIAAARLELQLALFAAEGLDGDLGAYRKYLRGGLRGKATEAAKLAAAPRGSQEAVRAARAALVSRDDVIHCPPVAVVVPDGAEPGLRTSASGHWRIPTKDENALPQDVVTTAHLLEVLTAPEAAWWLVVNPTLTTEPPPAVADTASEGSRLPPTQRSEPGSGQVTHPPETGIQ